jgi:hypothetical protein
MWGKFHEINHVQFPSIRHSTLNNRFISYIIQLTRWSQLLEKLQVAQVLKNSPTFCVTQKFIALIRVAALYKASSVFPRSNTGIVGSNSTGDMDVCVRLFCVCVVLCVGTGLGTG